MYGASINIYISRLLLIRKWEIYVWIVDSDCLKSTVVAFWFQKTNKLRLNITEAFDCVVAMKVWPCCWWTVFKTFIYVICIMINWCSFDWTKHFISMKPIIGKWLYHNSHVIFDIKWFDKSSYWKKLNYFFLYWLQLNQFSCRYIDICILVLWRTFS